MENIFHNYVHFPLLLNLHFSNFIRMQLK